MAVDKLVDSTQLNADLTSVANAIRTKGGTNASLAFPADFVSAIGAIPTGGGGFTFHDLIYKTEPSGVITITADADIPLYALCRNTAITRLVLDMGTYKFGRHESGQYAGNGYNLDYNAISSYHIIHNNSAFIPGYFCRTDEDAENVLVIRGSNNGGIGQSALRNDAGVTIFDYTYFGTGNIGASAFRECNKLATIIIRGNALIPMANISAFSFNNIWKSGGSGGTIYISKAMYDHLGDGTALDYKAATNWSTVDGYGTITWAKIEGSIYETQYADGTTIPTS